MNPILQFAASLAESLLKAMLKEATPVLIGVSKEVCGAIYEIGEAELSSRYSAETKRSIERDMAGVLGTAWQVCMQEGLLLAEDVVSLMAMAAWTEIKDFVSGTPSGDTGT